MTNLYTTIIAEGLQVDIEDASLIQTFINYWLADYFRWGSSTVQQIIDKAKQAQKMIADPAYASMVEFVKVNA